MFDVCAKWNLFQPGVDIEDSIRNIELRGYNSDGVYLTGEFRNKLVEELTKPLSVSNISDKYCYSRRDLYFYKGINRLKRSDQQKRWGAKTGHIAEKYIRHTLDFEINQLENSYSSIKENQDDFHKKFIKYNQESFEELLHLEQNSQDTKGVDTQWLLTLLRNNARADLSIKILHSLIKERGSLDPSSLKIKEEIRPNFEEIGINSPVEADFIAPTFGIVGDIKTGEKFDEQFQLTCAGYALAYENEKGRGGDINWGIIYFLPTRNPSYFVKPLTYAQVYIFAIDDFLRQKFIDIRNKSYKIISKDKPPEFPPEGKRKHCKVCKFKDHCLKEGLKLSDNGQ